MKYAFFPGCVSRGGCPELYQATTLICQKLGIEIQEMPRASCTGAGVLQEKNQVLGDTLNARTFALAEELGLPILTICSTCQGVMGQANLRLKSDPEYLAKINSFLAEEGLEYKGGAQPKHLLWVLIEDYGLDKLLEHVTRPLVGVRMAPFYGCYLVRPPDALDIAENPGAPGLAGAPDRRPGGDRGGFLGQNTVLRVPDSHNQREELGGNGGQAYVRGKGPGRRRHGNSLSALPSEPGWLPTQGR